VDPRSGVERLILFGVMVRYSWGEDYRHMPERSLDTLSRIAAWGKGAMAHRSAPSLAVDPGFVRYMARLERMSATPASMMALRAADSTIDVRAILPDLQIPTLIIQRKDDP
jgi:pimeloyl-ACP methyl ester carboxylesterase